jgi:predicted DCC family thiol-disulfide oxidoreductase YuxK
MLIESVRHHLLFDGDCGICTWSAEQFKLIDRDGRFVVAPYQVFDEVELARFGVTHAECAQSLQVITRQGRVHRGAFGVNFFLWQSFPWSLVVVLIYAIPVLLLFEIIGYRLTANNRLRLSRWFGMKACLVRRQ